MGLHSDVKKYLKIRFKNSVNSEIPKKMCETQICDLMWMLFKYHPEEHSVGKDLVDFFWKAIEQFFTSGGVTYVCVFDIPKFVPVAKSEEHKKRYGGSQPDPLLSDVCDNENLPRPWLSALANRKVRSDMITFIADGLAQKFAVHKTRFSGCAMYVSGAHENVHRIDCDGTHVCPEHAPVTNVGEGDLAVAYWVQHFHDRSTVVRVLDSDQIPILQLRAHLAQREKPLFIWLVTPRRNEDLEYHGYITMPFEGHTLIDVIKLNGEVRAAGLRVEEFCFHIICQKTDFVDKLITNLGVHPSLTALEKNASNAIHITASAARCDSQMVKKSFKNAILHSKRKRAEVRSDGDVEFRRAWWTLCYWAFAWKGPLPTILTPSEAFGFTEKGFRVQQQISEKFPIINFDIEKT